MNNFLQLFADGSRNTNVTTQQGMSPEIKTFYDTELLENARIDMYYEQFGKKQPLPRNNGKTVEWRKWNTFAKASALVEGEIPTGQTFGATNITDSIAQYGTYATISDSLELHSYDDVILGATTEMGASAAETQETLIRNALLTTTNVMFADKITVSSGAAATVTKQGDLVWNDTYHCPLTPTMVNKIRTAMIKNRVPKINGKYVMVVHPSCVFDLRQSTEWIEAHKYAGTTEIYNGEIGELHGIRFIENPFAPVLKGDDLASDTRTLSINKEGGYSGAVTSVKFGGSTAGVEADALIGRIITINGVSAKVTDNTADTLTFASTNFGTVADNAVIYPGEGDGEGKAVYANFVFGLDAFGIIDVDGGALEMIVHDKDEIGGPLNQYSTIGYKLSTNGAKILYNERMINFLCTSSYSSSDVGNV